SKKSHSDHASAHANVIHAERFIFCDRRTGTRRFEVPARTDGTLPIDQAASLLAIQCVARQQDPRDFCVMIAVEEDLLESLVGQAKHLIRSCSDNRFPVPLSRRQHEVLKAVSQNLTNKEIADRLNVSVRTVKFHVSSLLEKFDVRGRTDLMLEAEMLSGGAVHRRRTTREGAAEFPEAPDPASTGSKAHFRGPVSLDRRAGGR